MFIPTVTNTSRVDKSKYKIVPKNQFACNLMHVSRDERISIALNLSDEPDLVSPAYKVFEIIDCEELDPNYLILLFKRNEMDRKAGFRKDDNVRLVLKWESLRDILIPKPSIE